jgi:flagellar motor switch protein FliM
MTENRIGGGESRTAFLVVFVLGVLIGSFVRVAAFVMPQSTVEYLMRKLLPMSASD